MNTTARVLRTISDAADSITFALMLYTITAMAAGRFGTGEIARMGTDLTPPLLVISIAAAAASFLAFVGAGIGSAVASYLAGRKTA